MIEWLVLLVVALETSIAMAAGEGLITPEELAAASRVAGDR